MIGDIVSFLGDIRKGTEVNPNRKDRAKYIYIQCPICGDRRWTSFRKGEPGGSTCKSCSYYKSPIRNWKGGRYGEPGGCIFVHIPLDSPFRPMICKASHVAEHRLVMAQHLGRCLETWEVVHHKNGIKDDNRIENLELVTRKTHYKSRSEGYKEGYKDGYWQGFLDALEDKSENITERSYKK